MTLKLDEWAFAKGRNPEREGENQKIKESESEGLWIRLGHWMARHSEMREGGFPECWGLDRR